MGDPKEQDRAAGAPDRAQIARWTSGYGPLVECEVAGTFFIARQISRADFAGLQQAYTDEWEADEALCCLATLHPKSYNFSEGLAGVATTLASEILSASGYGENYDVGAKLTKLSDTMLEQANRFDLAVLLAFPTRRKSELEEMPTDLWLREVAMALTILRLQNADEDFLAQFTLPDNQLKRLWEGRRRDRTAQTTQARAQQAHAKARPLPPQVNR